MDDNDEFLRELELENCNQSLKFIQKNVGGVNCVIWDAAIVLAKYLDFTSKDNKWLRDKKVLELGSGLGCAGLTAACLGANVLLTDLKDALLMLERNVKINESSWNNSGGVVNVEVLDWGTQIKFNFCPDLILLADCVYYEKSIEPLLETLETLLNCNTDRRTYAILSQEKRDTPKQIVVWENFFAELNNRFKIEQIPIEQQHPIYSSSDIYLIKIYSKQNHK